MNKKTEIRFSFFPLLFLLFPIAMLIFPIFVGFKDPEYVYVAILNGQGITAAVSLYRCFMLESSFGRSIFWLGLAFSFALGVYGILSSFIVKLRETKIIGIFGLCALFGCMGSMIIAHTLLVAHIEDTTKLYFETVERLVEPTSGYAHATLFFYLEMGLPVLVFFWWLTIVILNFKAIKKAGTNPVISEEKSLLESDEGETKA